MSHHNGATASIDARTKWKGMTMLESNKTKSTIIMTGAQGMAYCQNWANIENMILIGAHWGYHNLKLDENHHIWQHLHVNLAGSDIWDNLSEQPQLLTCSRENVRKYSRFMKCIERADDTLVVGYDSDSVHYNETITNALEICEKENLKLDK